MPGRLPGGSSPLPLHLKQGLHTLPFPKRERKPRIQPPAEDRQVPQADPPRLGPHTSLQDSLAQEGAGPGLTCLSRADRTGRAEICARSVGPGARILSNRAFLQVGPTG